MKSILFVLLFQWTATLCFGQQTELSVQASSGLFSFGGKYASSDPNFFINDMPPNYLLNPYSKKSSFSYGLAMQIQRVTNKNGVLGVRVGYDQLSTISHFDRYGSMSGIYDAENGKVNFRNNLIQINPYFGVRLPVRNIHVDLTAGVNAGSIRKSTYTVSFDGQSDFFERKTKNYFINTKVDFGPTLGLAAEYKRVGINATYLYGVVNYMKNMGYTEDTRVYSRYLRFGVFYRIK